MDERQKDIEDRWIPRFFMQLTSIHLKFNLLQLKNLSILSTILILFDFIINL